MTLPASGQISAYDINIEMGVSGTAQRSLNDSTSRTLAGVPSGTISLNDFHGKANRVTINLNASGNNYDIFANRGGTYIAGLSDVIVSASGLMGSTSISTGALETGSGWAAGDTITVNNYATVEGMAGNGGYGASDHGGNSGGNYNTNRNGSAGGLAFRASYYVTFNNYAVVGGGGGGGGGGDGGYTGNYGTGGGGGGGQGYTGGAGGVTGWLGVGPVGADGVAGSWTGPGAGGAGGDSGGNGYGGNGGAGGVLGAVGGNGATGSSSWAGIGYGGAAGLAVVGVGYINGGAGIGGTVYGAQT